MYLNDRQRVEINLPTHMMLAAFIAGVEDQTSEEFKAVKADLIEASEDCLRDMQERKAISLLRRTTRLLDELTREHIKEGAEVAKVALITFHFMRFIIEDNYLQYTEDSAFARSIEKFMEALEHKAQEPKVNASAIKQAKKMLKACQQQGYYRDVNPPDE
jgi:hypothetical protein